MSILVNRCLRGSFKLHIHKFWVGVAGTASSWELPGKNAKREELSHRFIREGFGSNFFRNGRGWFSRNKHGFHYLLKFLQILKDIKSLESIIFSSSTLSEFLILLLQSILVTEFSHPGTSLHYPPSLNHKSSYLLVYSFYLSTSSVTSS